MTREQEELLALIEDSERIVALTGAGISTASGIPDFRSPGGLWEDVDPMEVATLTVFREDPKRFWSFYRSRLDIVDEFDPNPGHFLLADLHQKGLLTAVSTQNIDGLHQKSGLPEERVFEVHGSVRNLVCLSCDSTYPRERIEELWVEAEGLPRCECGEVLKPAVTLFEEMLPEEAFAASVAAISEADLLLIVGSSMVVHPAASLPAHLPDTGRIAILNDEPTPWREEAALWLSGDIASNSQAIRDALAA
ncbi:MAG: SIR2 family NAD-dependent protein deacylase [Solirubrobacterales bacterium]